MEKTYSTLNAIWKAMSSILKEYKLEHYAFGGFVRDMEMLKLSKNNLKCSPDILKFLENKHSKTIKKDVDIMVLNNPEILINKIVNSMKRSLEFHCTMCDKSCIVTVRKIGYGPFLTHELSIHIGDELYHVDLRMTDNRIPVRSDFIVNSLTYDEKGNLAIINGRYRPETDSQLISAAMCLRDFEAIPCENFLEDYYDELKKILEFVQKDMDKKLNESFNLPDNNLFRTFQRIKKMDDYGYKVKHLQVPVAYTHREEETFFVPSLSSPNICVQFTRNGKKTLVTKTKVKCVLLDEQYFKDALFIFN
jgi:hypothetical protein